MGASVRNDVSNQGTKQSSIITSTGIPLILKIKVTVINFKVKPTLSTLRSLKFVTGLLNVFESKQEHISENQIIITQTEKSILIKNASQKKRDHPVTFQLQFNPY